MGRFEVAPSRARSLPQGLRRQQNLSLAGIIVGVSLLGSGLERSETPVGAGSHSELAQQPIELHAQFLEVGTGGARLLCRLGGAL